MMLLHRLFIFLSLQKGGMYVKINVDKLYGRKLMNRYVSCLLTIVILTSVLSVSGILASADMPSPDALGGYENVCLTYTFRTSDSDYGRHYQEDLMPYVAYLDTEGNIKDFFFDSYLFLPCMDFGPSGARMHVDVDNPTKAIDWISYVEDTFHKGANVDALESALSEAKQALGDTERKAGVFFTILYPCENATDFGELGGRQLDFSKIEDRKYAVKWMIDEQLRLYNERGYENLELVGFYWLEEYLLQTSDIELFQYASEYLHSFGMKFIWIPWYVASGYNLWENLGFDVVCMQPNMYWMSPADYTRVDNCINICKREDMCMEIEVDPYVGSAEYFNRYLTYLQDGMSGGAMDSIKMYYQDGKPAVYYTACYSDNERMRSVYDLTYKYAKGTLTNEDIDINRAQEFKIPDDVDWISIGKEYTGCESYIDGNGCDYQRVSGKELTDGLIAIEPLGTDWHAFHTSVLDNEKRMSVTVDLGEVRSDLTDFMAHFDNAQQSGIGSPADIRFYISENGTDFTLLAEPELVPFESAAYISYNCEPVTARYVKLSFINSDKPFVFCSEFLVGVEKEITQDVESDVSSSDSSELSTESEFTEIFEYSGDSDEKPTGENDNVKSIIISAAIIALIAIAVVTVTVILRKRRK